MSLAAPQDMSVFNPNPRHLSRHIHRISNLSHDSSYAISPLSRGGMLRGIRAAAVAPISGSAAHGKALKTGAEIHIQYIYIFFIVNRKKAHKNTPDNPTPLF